jgi:hypothetical protein
MMRPTQSSSSKTTNKGAATPPKKIAARSAGSEHRSKTPSRSGSSASFHSKRTTASASIKPTPTQQVVLVEELDPLKPEEEPQYSPQLDNSQEDTKKVSLGRSAHDRSDIDPPAHLYTQLSDPLAAAQEKDREDAISANMTSGTSSMMRNALVQPPVQPHQVQEKGVTGLVCNQAEESSENISSGSDIAHDMQVSSNGKNESNPVSEVTPTEQPNTASKPVEIEETVLRPMNDDDSANVEEFAAVDGAQSSIQVEDGHADLNAHQPSISQVDIEGQEKHGTYEWTETIIPQHGPD